MYVQDEASMPQPAAPLCYLLGPRHGHGFARLFCGVFEIRGWKLQGLASLPGGECNVTTKRLAQSTPRLSVGGTDCQMRREHALSQPVLQLTATPILKVRTVAGLC